jgi:hypothetical protein
LVFSGYISKYKLTFGSTDDISLTCLSNGQDLNNYLIESGDSAYITQATDDGNFFNVGSSGDKGFPQFVLQTFTVSGAVEIGAVSVEITTPTDGNIGISLYEQVGASPDLTADTQLTNGDVSVATVTKSVQKVTFTSPTTLSTGHTYYFLVGYGTDGYAQIFCSTSNPYASGDAWTVEFAGTSWSSPTEYSSDDLYFIIWEHGGSTVAEYDNEDVAFMLTDVMNNYIARGGLVSTGFTPVAPLYSLPYQDTTQPTAFWAAAYAQTFTPPKNITINLLQLMIGISSGSQDVQISLCRGDPSLDTVAVIDGGESYTFGGSNTVIASTNTVTIANTSPAITTFEFATPQNLSSGTEYYFLIQYSQGESGNMIMKGAGSGDLPISVVGFGEEYYGLVTVNNSGASMSYHTTAPAMFMNLLYADPIPSNLNGGYENTGVTTSYAFKQQTILDAIQVLIGFAPADWYWYVDPAENVLVFKESSDTPDIYLVRGKHINELEVEATKENIINVAYFTGGDDGTDTNTNIFVKQTTALGGNRVGLGLISDNRVTGTGGADVAAQILESYLAQNADETYITTVTVQDTTIDTNLFNIGMMVGFAGFGDFVDNLLLQVSGKNKASDQIILQLGTLPVRSTQAVSQLEAALTSVQTLDNPATPS